MKNKLSILLFIVFAISIGTLHAQKAPKPYGVLPSERQLRWHEMEMYALIHYTPTTFQNKEWGYGDAPTDLFNPSAFDANQIAAATASAGFKGLISVAKHHDGFCLWPTATTTYSITSSPWKEGKGDMVKDFMQASHDHGLQFGVYLSAWDRNDTRYGTPAYAEAYREQLKELMTQYGPLFTSWHDGANGGDGYYGGLNEKRTIDRTTYYEWEEKTWPIVRKYQPLAMIFSDIGPDMRWVGNEKGFAAETSWATFTPEGIDGQKPVPGLMNSMTLPEGTRNGKYWIPAECDVPHRPGWFYHPEQDKQVKSPEELFEIYLKSVGRGANMNLGLAPMPEGILHQNDVVSLQKFGEKIRNTFAVNIAANAKIKASNTRGNNNKYGTQHILDGDRYTYWASDDGIHTPELEVEVNSDQLFDIIRIRENIKLGQRIDSIQVEIWENNSWSPLAAATSIGANRLIKLEKPVKAEKLKLKIYAPVCPTLSDFALFKEADVDYTDTEVADHRRINAHDIQIVDIEKHTPGIKRILNNPNKSVWINTNKTAPKITLELKEATPLSGVGYLTRQDGIKEGIPTHYEIEASADGHTWNTLSEGEFSNIIANPTMQFIPIKETNPIKFIRFTAKKEMHAMTEYAICELILYKDQ